MYCLDKLQRELAYFFSKDIRELPKVESILAEAGYTQIRKGDEIIKLDSALGLESAIAAPRELDRPPVLSHPRDLQSTDPTSQILESQSGITKQTQSPTQNPRILETESTQAQKVDSNLSQEIKDIIDSSPAKGRDMQIIGEANFTPQVVEYAHKNNKKVAIDKLEQAEAERLGFKHPQDVRVTIDYQAINHTLNRHGAESALVKNSGQKAVDYTDIAEYRNIVKGADEKLFSKDDLGQDVILSFKQVNGYAVVVESIRKKGNELAFKNMYFENGSYKNSNAYKNAVDSQKANHSPAPYGYEPHADDSTPPLKANDEIIPQNSTKAQTEYFNPFMNEYEKIKEIKKLHTQDDVLVRVMKLNDRYIEPLSNMSVSKEYLQKQTAQSLKENITQAILGNQTQLKALQQGYNTYHLSSFQKEVLESVLDIANNPTKLKEYKLQGLQKQLDNLNSNEAYHIEKGREYDKARYAKDRQELEKEISALKGTESSLESAPQKVDSSDIIFTDKKGKEHTLTKEVQERWCETFNLKSLDESYTPKHSDEILQALGGKEIKLQLGSLKKLVAQGREKYIPQIKEVLDSPEAIMRDDMGEYLFIKHLKDDDYFVNVSFDNGEYLVSISNGIKETRNLNNKLEKGGSFIYQSPNFNSISQKLLQTSQYSANKIDSEIIPQEKKLNTPSDLGVEFGANFAEYFLLPRSLANPRTRNALRELYHASEKSQDNLALFDKVLEVAGNLKVKTQGKPTRDSAGMYYPAENRLTIRTHMPTRTIRMYGANITQGGAAISEEDIAQTLLHELIHSTISTAQLALTHKDFAPMAKALTQEQKHALEEIHTLYKLIKREHSHAKKWHTLPINDTYYYGLKNEREFIAELANPNFRDYLQRQNIFMRVINAVLKFFTKAKAKPTDTPTTALESLQNAYMKFLENFNYEHYINTRQEALKGVKDEIQARELESSYTYTTGEAKGIAELRKDLKQALEPSLNKEIVNKEQGLSGVITTEEVKKIMSSKAVAKSVANGFSRDEHIEVAKHIEKLFTESKLLRSHKDYKENPNILQVHRFVKDIEVNGKEANALITLFEKMQGKNKIYTIELESLENLPPLGTQAKSAETAVKAQSAAATPTEAAPIAKTDKYSIAQKLQTLKTKQDKLSRQIDEYKHKHNIPQFTGFGKRSIQIDDPHYQSLQAEYSDLTKQIQALQLQLVRQATPQSPPSKLESTKVSASPNPYQDFKTTPQSWADIEKVKGQDYIESLKQWHNHSHKSSKNTDGSPKVFYHGTRSDKFEVFEAGTSESGRDGIYFSTSPNIAKDYDIWDQGVYEVFLHYKNPLEIDFKGTPYNSKQGREILKTIPQKLSKDHDAIIYKNIRDNNQRGAGELADTIVVFEPNQIKHIENRGVAGQYFYSSSPNIFHSNPHAGAGLLVGSVAGVEQDENGNLTFSPEKFALGLLGGTGGSIAISKAVGKHAASGKYAIMRRMEAKKHNKKLYNVFKAIDSSAKYGSKMNLIGKENLNADTLAYALARNKRFAINKLDEKVAKELGFKYPQDVRRTIQPDEIIHTLTRHGENSDLARLSGQKPVTLDEIAKYQDYADNAQVKQESKDKSNNRVLISVGQLDNGFLVVIEQIRKGQNELGYKNMYFENGILNDETLTRIFKK